MHLNGLVLILAFQICVSRCEQLHVRPGSRRPMVELEHNQHKSES